MQKSEGIYALPRFTVLRFSKEPDAQKWGLRTVSKNSLQGAPG